MKNVSLTIDRVEASHAGSPIALLSDGEGRRLQGEDLRAHTQLTHAAVDHLAVLGAGVQDGHRPLA